MCVYVCVHEGISSMVYTFHSSGRAKIIYLMTQLVSIRLSEKKKYFKI